MKKSIKMLMVMVLMLSMVTVPNMPAMAKTKQTPYYKQYSIAKNFTNKWLNSGWYVINDINKDSNVDLIWIYQRGNYYGAKVFTYRRGRGMLRSTKELTGLDGVGYLSKYFVAQVHYNYTGLGYSGYGYDIYKFSGTKLKKISRWKRLDYSFGTVVTKNGKRRSIREFNNIEQRIKIYRLQY